MLFLHRHIQTYTDIVNYFVDTLIIKPLFGIPVHIQPEAKRLIYNYSKLSRRFLTIITPFIIKFKLILPIQLLQMRMRLPTNVTAIEP